MKKILLLRAQFFAPSFKGFCRGKDSCLLLASFLSRPVSAKVRSTEK